MSAIQLMTRYRRTRPEPAPLPGAPVPGRTGLAILLAACVGFALGGLHEAPAPREVPLANAMLDPRLEWHSFSEVDLARATLRMYADEYVRRAQQTIAETLRQRAENRDPTRATNQPSLQPVIELLEDALTEFQGTGLETEILRPLLFALKHEGRHQRWLDLYLQTLRQHPADPIVSDFLADAQDLARTTGRESELLDLLTLPLAAATSNPHPIPQTLAAGSICTRSLPILPPTP
ncbi:hypothetical protein G4L39_13935 [Limisphaera ngatamarikiensis]|uniref:Uncharacterized protein n=1 Tax=Limisphaera ngatamarikiensis TaxID=1324935 RepID=A0A6M1RYR8_9BACT|nr:hypothetical protein [Limisphaera ngatamarikiensis]NGO40484.1 hypothetical protein [Limisphaera ngatamarikiensis]